MPDVEILGEEFVGEEEEEEEVESEEFVGDLSRLWASCRM